MSALGFLNIFLLARIFGAGSQMDSYFFALSIPSFISSLLVAFFLYGSVPALACAERFDRSAKSLVVASCLFAFPFFAISFSYFILFVLTSTSAPYSGELDILMLSLSWFLGGAQVIFGALSAILNSQKHFFAPSLLMALVPAGSILLIQLSRSFSDISFSLLGMIFGLLFSIFFAFALLMDSLRGSWTINLADLKVILKGNGGAFTTLLASSSFAVFSVIDASLAPRFGDGALSSLSFVQRIVIGFGNIAVFGIFTKAGPSFPASLEKYGFQKFRLIVASSVFNVFLVSSLIGIVLSSRLDFFVSIFFRGNQHSVGSMAFGSLLYPMLAGMVFMLCSAVLLRAMLCLRNSDFLVFSFGISVPLSYYVSCSALASHGVMSFGISYLLSWFLGFCLLSFRFFFPPSISSISSF